MKKFSKILSVALLVALVLSLGVASAFAEGDASITITHNNTNYNPASGSEARVYSAYKIFDAEYTGELEGANGQGTANDTFTYTPDNAAVSYTMATDSPWLSVMQADGQTWFDVTLAGDGSKYIVTPKAGYTDAADAKEFGDYLAANIPSGASATDVTVDGAAAAVDKGYYLIVGKDSEDAVTRVAVVTTDVTMVEKNTYITTGKTTSETSYNVGDTVTYTATVFIPSDTALTQTDNNGAYVDGHGPVILHDKMDSRLTFSKTVTAKMDDADFTAFTVVNPEGNATALTDECTFELNIPVNAAVLGKTITFTYTATVNETAVNDEGFVNELGGELNGYKTNPVDVKVYTFDFKFNKSFDGSTDDKLEATFEVRTTADDENTAIAFVKQTDKVNGYTVYKKAMTAGETGSSTTITLKNLEKVDLIGLAAGDYWLVETSTATGYNLLTGPVKVTITDTTDKSVANWTPSHKVSYGDGTNMTEAGEIPVVNNSGTVLPSTGGIGTTIFYVVGGVLVLAAIILLVTKKRMSE